MRIVVAGSGRLAAGMMTALLDSRHELVGVVQDGRITRGIMRAAQPALDAWMPGESIAGRAWLMGLPIVWIDTMTDEELAPLRNLAPDLLLVGGFGIIFKPPLLQLPRLGCVNMHSSLLPKHRGPNPFQAVVLAGERQSGVTFHVMNEGIDTGDILAQYTFPVAPNATARDVYHAACAAAAQHVTAVMDRIEAQGLHGAPQDHTVATYDKRLTEADTWIRWDQSAAAIDRLARALYPSLLLRFRHNGREIRVRRLEIRSESVQVLPGTVLEVDPCVVVATAAGSVRIVEAYGPKSFPWPGPWRAPKTGEVLQEGQ